MYIYIHILTSSRGVLLTISWGVLASENQLRLCRNRRKAV